MTNRSHIDIVFFALIFASLVSCSWSSDLVISDDRLLSPSHSSFRMEFGYSVAIDGPVTIVGARNLNTIYDNTGAVFIYDSFSGEQNSFIIPNDVKRDHIFGVSLSLSGSIAAVGSRSDEHHGDQAGSVYLLDLSNPHIPTQAAKIVASDGMANDAFGNAVCIFESTLIVGALDNDEFGGNSGKAYIFDVSDPFKPKETSVLTSGDAMSGHFFGWSVSTNGSIAAIGAIGVSDDGFQSGAVYLYDVETGAQLAKIRPEIGAAQAQFGRELDISGNLLVVSANRYNGQSGAVYLFDISDPTFPIQLEMLRDTDPMTNDRFGSSVAISDRFLVVGTDGKDIDGTNEGLVYVYDTVAFERIATIMPRNTFSQSHFGASADIDSDIIVVGANSGISDNGQTIGSVHQVDLPCLADLNVDFITDFEDIEILLKNLTDLNGDGEFDFVDISLFVSAFVHQCD